MNITLTGSLGNINKELIGKLTSAGHQVKVISHSPERATAIEALQATPLIGSVTDAAFVSAAFAGADAVYLMTPPNVSTADVKGYIKATGQIYADAIDANGVGRVINLSSIGAHKADGLGPTGANYAVEHLLNNLEGVDVLHLRPGLFYSNFYGSIPVIKYQGIMGNNFDADVTVALTDPADIAAAIANTLNAPAFSGKKVEYVVSDLKTGGAIAAILGEAIGIPHLPWIAFPDEVLLPELLKSGMSAEMANVYIIEIGIALRNNSLLEDYYRHREEAAGGTKFEEFAKTFAYAYATTS
ncbi:NAD(P)H-binding protein [Taibaiella koreensis]|uniref:NAD(P)H-binding protein n=1 Tax=Taibaiella koreensis TaxID=1268548 RepID=UPI0013C2A1BA|nr:NAD(P)H-binding protein [Taibaiella koreensis]